MIGKTVDIPKVKHNTKLTITKIYTVYRLTLVNVVEGSGRRFKLTL